MLNFSLDIFLKYYGNLWIFRVNMRLEVRLLCYLLGEISGGKNKVEGSYYLYGFGFWYS